MTETKILNENISSFQKKANKTDKCEPEKVFLVLEGGGAKGIVHIAALKELEESLNHENHQIDGKDNNDLENLSPIEIVGITGASIGALVAACYAAGGKADDLFNKDGLPILAHKIGIDHPWKLFGSTGWKRIKSLRDFLKNDKELFSNSIFSQYKLAFILFMKFLFLTASVTFCFITAAKTISFSPVIFFLASMTWIGLLLLHLSLNDLLKKINFWPKIFGFVSGTIFYTLIFAFTLWLLIEKELIVKANFGNDILQKYYEILPKKYLDIIIVFFLMFCFLYVIFHHINRLLKGIVHTKLLEKNINQALSHLIAKGLFGNDTSQEYKAKYTELCNKGARFSDLPKNSPVLKILIADVLKQTHKIFSKELTPDKSIAEAVVASMAVPGIFQLPRNEKGIYADTALVSNIPAWLFSTERVLYPNACVLAVQIEPGTPDNWIAQYLALKDKNINGVCRRILAKMYRYGRYPYTTLVWPFVLLKNIINTAVFGTGELEMRGYDRIERVTLATSVNLLDFDLSETAISQILEQQRWAIKLQLTEIFIARKQRFKFVADHIQTILKNSEFKTKKMREELNEQELWYRVYLARKFKSSNSLRIIFTEGFDNEDIDDRLLFPLYNSFVGQCSLSNKVLFASGKDLNRCFYNGDNNKYRKKVRRNDIQTCWAIPIRNPDLYAERFQNDFEDIPSDFVLVIESNATFDYFGLQNEQKSSEANLKNDDYGSSSWVESFAVEDETLLLQSQKWADLIWDETAKFEKERPWN